MVKKISVRVSGLNSLDDPDRLYKALTAETGLTWIREQPEGERAPVLGTLEDLFLATIVGKTGELVAEYAFEKVKEVLRRFTSEYLEPPEVSVEMEPVPELGETTASDGPAEG
ncbi:hypothetical protein POF50_031250 [Streptomyces sp. SL13]|uniref:Uncharacterized protein n=1 Tax=Streptantibioticus silvisoli TaxID=2705255 RepID=A0AA90H9P3_9ACTN|nr:hypothetical protein [Streptantibioticus silvisoli]MDI5966462.1 hypothetical protein [Streptantibioticus silvisoli]MDI5973765.1 hypothetical protein [Streptantibioticus silvisoli]